MRVKYLTNNEFLNFLALVLTYISMHDCADNVPCIVGRKLC